jgi:hypothetical protein
VQRGDRPSGECGPGHRNGRVQLYGHPCPALIGGVFFWRGVGARNNPALRVFDGLARLKPAPQPERAQLPRGERLPGPRGAFLASCRHCFDNGPPGDKVGGPLPGRAHGGHCAAAGSVGRDCEERMNALSRHPDAPDAAARGSSGAGRNEKKAQTRRAASLGLGPRCLSRFRGCSQRMGGVIPSLR